MKIDRNPGHLTTASAECPTKRAFPARHHAHAVTPNPAIRDCVECELPFFSSSAANVVCLVCKDASTAEFDQGEP